jgi:putative ABC transport system substrate-binding protein
MRRREFIAALAVAAAAPLAAHAQQPSTPTIGWLNSQTPDELFLRFLAAYRRGLGEQGFVEGRNVAIEYRWADNHFDRLPALAAELVARRVDLIVSGGGDTPTHIAKAATSTIPIVFALGSDPVAAGFAASLNRPGGNMTGVTMWGTQLNKKMLELLRELVPSARTMAVLLFAGNQRYEERRRETADAARALGLMLNQFGVNSAADIDAAFAAFAEQGSRAVLVTSDPFFGRHKDRIVALCARYRIPAMYNGAIYVEAGGLIGYGMDFADLYRQLGVLSGRILKGAKPGDLAIEQMTNYEMTINLTTARALGIAIPESIRARANQVFE